MVVCDIVHREEFAAAHRLRASGLSDQENRDTFGPCYELHGHNYVLEVTVRGEVDPRTGMVMNLADLERAMREDVIDHVDHRCLNEDVPFLSHLDVTTAENLAVTFWERLAEREPEWGRARLHRVRVVESASNFVDYYGPGQK